MKYYLYSGFVSLVPSKALKVHESIVATWPLRHPFPISEIRADVPIQARNESRGISGVIGTGIAWLAASEMKERRERCNVWMIGEGVDGDDAEGSGKPRGWSVRLQPWMHVNVDGV